MFTKDDFNSARQLFTTTLTHAVSTDSPEELFSVVQSCETSTSGRKSVVDQVFRDALKNTVSDSRKTMVYKQLINWAVQAVIKEMCSASTPFLMLSDAFDMITLEQCEEVFDLVEENVSMWKSETLFEAGKNYLLRMSNDLLRRLSKSQNTVFCGRIQLFLARLFPLSEKSALNLMSQFNLENLTVYSNKVEDSKFQMTEDAIDTMEIDGEESEQASSIPVDYYLYRKFWSLQDYFRKPAQCYEKIAWRTFSSNTTDVLKVFDSHKLEDLKSSRKKLDRLKQTQSHAYFAKYLTNEKLLNLQLSDCNFRRYVLVQFLIIFKYLNSPVKFKTASQTLSDDQVMWVKETDEKVYRLIQETGPDGETFANSVKHILAREENWNQWKNDSCQSYERYKSADVLKLNKRARQRSIGDDVLASGGKVIKMGSAELTRLWNLNPDNMAACKSEKRIFLPTVEDFFADAIEQADPANMVEEEYKLVNSVNFQWQALRLLARRSPHFFVHNNQCSQTIPSYLETMVKKLASEMPVPAEEMTAEVDDDDEMREAQEEEESQTEADNEDEEEKVLLLSKDEIEAVAEKLGTDWKKLATELHFGEDEIQDFEEENPDQLAVQAHNMLAVWANNEPDRATPGNLRTALREVGLTEIVEELFKDVED